MELFFLGTWDGANGTNTILHQGRIQDFHLGGAQKIMWAQAHWGGGGGRLLHPPLDPPLLHCILCQKHVSRLKQHWSDMHVWCVPRNASWGCRDMKLDLLQLISCFLILKKSCKPVSYYSCTITCTITLLCI